MNITRIIKRSQTDAVYMEVENGNAADALEAGDVVELELSADYPGKSVVDGTADDPLAIGVVIGKAVGDSTSIPAGEFGKIQIFGYCPLVKTDGSVDAGETLVAAASAVAKGAADGAGRLGVAVTGDASGTTCTAFLRCM